MTFNKKKKNNEYYKKNAKRIQAKRRETLKKKFISEYLAEIGHVDK